MRTYFSTPLFRLISLVINCSMLFPVFSYGISRQNSYFDFDQKKLISRNLLEYQLAFYKKLGVNFEQSQPTSNGKNEKSSSSAEKKVGENEVPKAASQNKANDRNLSTNQSDENSNRIKTALSENSTQKDSENGDLNENRSITVAETTLNSATKAKSKNNKDVYSAVKNLPDAEKLRASTVPMPTIKEPVPSADCLINTINCPSEKNKEFSQNGIYGSSVIKDVLSSILSNRNSISNNYSVNFSNTVGEPNRISFETTKTENFKQHSFNYDGFDSSSNSPLKDLFSDLEIYDPATPANYSASMSPLMLPPGGNGKVFDFDGDGKADVSIWRPDTGEWFVLRSSDGSVMTQANFGLGSSGDRIVPGNYDGDTKTDYAYWHPSTGIWTIKQSSNNQTVTYTLGQTGDLPVPGDYDGDGKTDAAVWRSSNGTWYYRKSSDGSTQSFAWGASADVPVVGDFDGDNKTDFTVVRPSDTNWYILQSSNGMTTIQWGSIGDRLVPGDYDGDGKSDVGVWRANDNTWYVRKSSNGVLQTLTWGISADYPVPADYDGDGKTDFAIWRTSSGEWWITQSSNNYQYGVAFGTTGDIPVPVSYVAYFSASNQIPIAVAGGPYSAAANTAIRFDGRASSDGDGQIYGYNWNFGDSTTGTGSRPSHTYTNPGTYTVTLTVTDNRGAVSAASSATVTVINATDARLDPFNAVGGDNPISRNFSWGTGLAGLPGRAGMGAGISLSYNSLVWLKKNNGTADYMVFDPDNGFPGPGFRMGMPVIERKHYNSQTGKYGYLMLTESGSRVEFRQVGASSIYETADSSYTQLIDYGASLLIRTTDGTQHSYQLIGNQFQCVQIKDSNGNYITAIYNSFNRLAQITDTLGRALVVNYDNNGNPLSVAQSYSGQQRVYATFGYEMKTVNTNFTSMTVAGPANNSQISVLKQVAFDDGSYVRFDYNSYGQIYQINSYAADGHKLNHVKYDLENPGVQTDCPRFTNKEDYAENWMTVTTQYAAPISTGWTMPDTFQAESGLMSKMTAPDGTEERIYYPSTGWNKGIPRLTETWGADKPGSPVIKQRWVTSHLTQDNTSLSYLQNPRTVSSAVGDSGNIRKSSVSYTNFTLPSGTIMYLPNDSFEYKSDGTSVYRHTQTDYNLNIEYVNRYIIGLISEKRLYAEAGTSSLQSKTSYGYDEETLIDLPNIIMHDTANYNVNFKWRGNPTRIQQWNVSNFSESINNKIGYNISGNSAWTQDPVQDTNHRIQISYNDNFSDGISRSSFAYPTVTTDADGYSIITKYFYFNSLVDEVQGPKPGQTNNNIRGAISKTFYDSVDRVQKIETLYPDRTSTGSYIRYEYPESMTEIKKITKQGTNFDEAFSFVVLDGNRKTIATADELPNEGYRGQIFLYDKMKRNWKTSLPLNTSATGGSNGWQTIGDDSQWLYYTESFDWKGRTLLFTNTDGSTRETIYNGCGCSGGQSIVTRDEAGRRRVVKYDEYGRVNKKQILPVQSKNEPLNNIGIPKLTEVSSFNYRDQLENIKVYSGDSSIDGSCPTSSNNVDGCQLSSFLYDGFGRVWKTHVPQQISDGYTTYSYYQDNYVSSIQDARGTIRNVIYDNRKNVSQISYTSNQNIRSVGTTYFQYDSVGNRLQMTDEKGISIYNYDSRALLVSESRTYTDLNITFSRSYLYNDGGLLTGILDNDGATGGDIIYTYDKIGRLKTINGSNYGNVNNYISDIKYRAWGSAKEINYSNNLSITNEFNGRLQPSKFEVKNLSNQKFMSIEYNYVSNQNANDNDGGLKSSKDLLNSKLNRNYYYNDLGDLTGATAGNLITVGSASGRTDGPYEQSYTHNIFGNLIARNERIWQSYGGNQFPSYRNYYYNYINNKRTDGSLYDNDGRLLQSNDYGQITNFEYDAAGRSRQISIPATSNSTAQNFFQDLDGDGNTTKSVKNGETEYYFHSSVINGKTLFVLNSIGLLKKSFIVTPTGDTIARYENGSLRWIHSDPSGVSNRESDSNGNIISKTETDPLSKLVDETSTYNYNNSGGYNNNPAGGFYVPGQGNSPYGLLGGRAGMLARWFRNISFNLVTNQTQQTTETNVCIDGVCDTPLIENHLSLTSNISILTNLTYQLMPVTHGPEGPPNPPPPLTCADILGIPDGFSLEGALARLIFLEATNFDTFFKGFFPKQTDTNSNYSSISQQGVEAATTNYLREMQTIGAVVFNIKEFIDTYPSSSYPDMQYTQLPPYGSSLLDIIYSKGASSRQFEGHYTDAGGYKLASDKYNRVQNALNGSADSSDCIKLRDAYQVAKNLIKNGIPSDLRGIVGFMTGNQQSKPSKNYEKVGQIDFSGNVFYKFKQSYIDSIIKSSKRVKK